MTALQRLGFTPLIVVALVGLGSPGAARDHDRHETRIPHEDGTGTATIIEVPKSLPGVSDFVRTTPAPIPQPGEIVLPPSATPTASPLPSPTPRR